MQKRMYTVMTTMVTKEQSMCGWRVCIKKKTHLNGHSAVLSSVHERSNLQTSFRSQPVEHVRT